MSYFLQPILALLIMMLAASPSVGQVVGSRAVAWEWRDSTGQSRNRAALDSVLAQHRRWLTSDKKAGRQANLRLASLTGADLDSADLREAIFEGAGLRMASLIAADLRNARLGDARLTAANLRGAQLGGANVRGADLSDVDLRQATLHLADIGYTDLAGARLEGVDLSTTRGVGDYYLRDGVYYDSQTRWPDGVEPPANLNQLPARLSRRMLQAADRLVVGWMPIVLIALIVVLIGLAIASSIKEQRAVQAQREKLKSLEEAAAVPASAAEFVQKELGIAIARERVGMLLAQGRSSRLVGLGSFFIILSVSAPVAAIYAYTAQDPLAIIERISAQKLVVDSSKLPLSRDWHLLLAGGTFGFLFIAAAAGVLRQAQHQTETYFRLARRVMHYESMISAVRIGTHLSTQQLDPAVSRLIGRVIDRLMTPIVDGPGQSQVPTQEEADSLGERVAEALRYRPE